MKKSEIETHAAGYYDPQMPAVNVKCYRWEPSAAEWEALEGEFPGLRTWCAESEDTSSDAWERVVSDAFEWAAESAWEFLQMIADDVLGDDAKVYSAGRSSGWAVVEGLPDIETWNAIAVSRWTRFAGNVRATADNMAYQTYWQIGANIFEPECERIDAGCQTWNDATAAYLVTLGIAS